MKRLGFAVLAVFFGLMVFTACNKQEEPKSVPAVSEEAAPAAPATETPAAPPAANPDRG